MCTLTRFLLPTGLADGLAGAGFSGFAHYGRLAARFAPAAELWSAAIGSPAPRRVARGDSADGFLFT